MIIYQTGWLLFENFSRFFGVASVCLFFEFFVFICIRFKRCGADECRIFRRSRAAIWWFRLRCFKKTLSFTGHFKIQFPLPVIPYAFIQWIRKGVLRFALQRVALRYRIIGRFRSIPDRAGKKLCQYSAYCRCVFSWPSRNFLDKYDQPSNLRVPSFEQHIRLWT